MERPHRKREGNTLYEGDIVYLNFQGDGYVHSDGFVDVRVGSLGETTATAATFAGCLFRVVPKLTYEAHKALRKVQEQDGPDIAEKVETFAQQVAAEVEANNALLQHIEASGSAVMYGQPVQLQHVASGKFLTSKAKTLADVDKTSMKVVLETTGSTKAQFTFIPRYKTRALGSAVMYRDSVCLARAKYTSHYLHLSPGAYPRDALGRSEVNISYKESVLRVLKYSENVFPPHRCLQAGKIYRLFHLECQAYITMSTNPHMAKPPYLRQILPDSNYMAPGNLSLKSLFVLERVDAKVGGPVQSFAETYRFRHLATGRYLALQANHEHNDERIDVVGAEANSDVAMSHFLLRPMAGENDSANNVHQAYCIETPEGSLRLHNPNRAKPNHALKQKASYYLAASTRLCDEDCFKLVEASATETYEASYLSSAVSHLAQYRTAISTALQRRQAITHEYLMLPLTALRGLLLFLVSDNDDAPILHRQEQGRECKLLDTLYELLRCAKENDIASHELAVDPALRVVHRVHRFVNQVLVAAVTNNLCNKTYVAKRSDAAFYARDEPRPTYMEETRGYFGSETGSKSVYRSLFLNNPALLEHAVDLDLVQTSCRNIEAKGVKAHGILHFLSTICACDGRNLPRNQELIVRTLYGLTTQTDLQTTRYNVLIEASPCPNPVRIVSPAVKDFVMSAPSGASQFGHNGHPLGYDMLTKGYVNIVVSWKAGENWTSGLFYPPSELALAPVVDAAMSSDLAEYDQHIGAAHRDWVLLEHIAWTLQPEEMFPAVFNGKLWADEWPEIERDHERLETFERIRSLANYYHLQLQLFAELLRGGCVTSIEILSAHFSYHMLLSGVANPCLPHVLRTSFSTMLHLCWLYRFPHEPLLVPRYVYNFDDIPRLDSQSAIVLAHYELKAGHPALSSDDEFISYPFADKFAFVQGVVHETMVHMSQNKAELSSVDANAFLSSLLVMVDWLIRCGFYPDMEAYQRLLYPLVRLLDGRNTQFTLASTALLNVPSTSSLDATARYHRNKLSDSMTRCKMQICKIFQAINIIWRSYEVYMLLSHFKHVGLQEMTEVNVDDTPEKQLKPMQGLADDAARLLTGSKKSNRFVQLFNKSPLDMRSAAKLPLATICLDLIMYDDDALVHEALVLLLQLHSRQDMVLNYLMQCVLVHPVPPSRHIAPMTISSCYVLKEMEYIAPLLRHYIQSFESPSLCDQLCDVNKVPLGYVGVARLLVEILKKLQEFCADIMSASDAREPNAEKQTILLQLHVHEDVMQLLRMPVAHLESRYRADMVAVKRECCIFFQRLMAKNPMGQWAMFPYLPELIARFEELQNIGDVLIAIFVDNRELCSGISEEAIWTTMKLLNELVGQLRAGDDSGLSTVCTILNFLTHYMIPDHVPMKANQVHLFSVLTHAQFEHTILPFAQGIDPSMEVSSIDIMTTDGYLALQSYVRDQGHTSTLFYFEKLLALLSSMCRGKTYKTEVECQQLYPLNFVLTLLLDAEMPLSLKVVAGKFLAEVFLDTDLQVDPRICVMPAVWNVLLHCSTQIAAYNAFLYKGQGAPSEAAPGPTFDELSRYVFEGNLCIVTAFFGSVYDATAEDLDEKTVHIVQALKSDIRSLKKRGKLDDAQREICDRCGIALGLPVVKKSSLPPLQVARPGIRHGASNSNVRHRNAIAKRRTAASLREVMSNECTFDQFKWSLLESTDISASIQDELQELVTDLERIEALTDKAAPGAGDDRANTVTKQLLCSRIIKFIGDNATSSCVVNTLEVLLRVVSSKHISEEARTSLQTAELEEAQELYQATQTFMASCGAAKLILTLIATAHNPATVLKAIEFGVHLVGGGNGTVQAMLYEGMQAGDERFFLKIDAILHAAIDQVREARRMLKYISEARQTAMEVSTTVQSVSGPENKNNILAFAPLSDANTTISGDVLVQFLSMLAEGHNLEMQLVMLDQTTVGNSVSINILQTVTSYLAILVKDEAQLATMSASDVSSLDACWLFLGEYMQGPCSANQEFLTGSVMVEIFRKTLKAQIHVLGPDTPPDLPTAEAIKRLKANAVKAMVSLLEGRVDDRVEVRLRSTLELKAIKNRLLEIFEQFHTEKNRHLSDTSWDERFLEEGVELFTLAMCVFPASQDGAEQLAPEANKGAKAPRRGEFASEAAFKAAKAEWRRKTMYAKAYNFFKDLHCTVEIWWGTNEPRLDTVHFPLPSHCRMFAFLTNKKEQLLNEFNYKSNERLKQFVDAAAELDEQMAHIELLSRFLLYNLLRPYIPLLKSLSFLLAIFMNLIMLVAFQHSDESLERHFVPQSLKNPMQYFGIIQIFLSSAVLLFMLVISVPLVFRARLNAMIKNSLDSYNARKSQRKLLEALEFDLADLKTIIQIDEVGKQLKKGVLGLQSTAKDLFLSVIQIYRSYLPLLRMILIIFLLQLTLLQAFPSFPTAVPFIILFWPFVRNTRHYLDTSCSVVGLVYTFIYDVVFDKHTAFYIVYLTTACLAYLYHPIFYGFHLLDLVIMSPSLQNVVRAVTKPGRALALTCLLGLFVIYFYTMVLFFFLPSDATDDSEHIPYCSTMIDCFVFFVHRGLLSGGGIGDFLTNGLNHPPNFYSRSVYWYRLLFDLSFFVLVIVLLLNIIFGITIDTFGELRTEANEKLGLMQNQCFICGLGRDVFDAHYLEQGVSDGFLRHIKHEHNMWSYLYFIVHLRSKDITNCSGPEAFVKTLLEKDDLSWFPQGMAKCLTKANVASTERELSGIKDHLKTLSAQMEHITSVATETA
ncbi:Inositol 1,4,5trisphosphate receptor type 2 [Achlya hypogyna]|uniref:Inositol 1,4,5trisphosphate receptor type 2 n=1 Tax=Achlya hypogyna TaxID=1202772 RepID=A0A1V9Z8I1_ACHHY|nr:Inositol 1,4,5trisphosphate receptor type 2 [Achlya hypogyna]